MPFIHNKYKCGTVGMVNLRQPMNPGGHPLESHRIKQKNYEWKKWKELPRPTGTEKDKKFARLENTLVWNSGCGNIDIEQMCQIPSRNDSLTLIVTAVPNNRINIAHNDHCSIKIHLTVRWIAIGDADRSAPAQLLNASIFTCPANDNWCRMQA